MLIQLHEIGKSFGEHLILKNIGMSIDDKGRYGLIGPNGAGKSTLLNIITGELEQDTGNVERSSNLVVGILKQDSGLDISSTIYEEMKIAFAHLTEKKKEMDKISSQLEIIDPERDTDEHQQLSQQYMELQNYYEVNDGYLMDVKIKTVLNGMGFGDQDIYTPVGTLSGGEKTRLALAKLLLREPSLLILDEPTNHLDFAMLNWLENYLVQYSGAIILVSHDRYFLDNTVDTIYELENHHLSVYTGNYSRYVYLKAERVERQQKEYEAQQKEIEKLEDYVRRNIARASTSKSAKSRQKALERMERVDAPVVKTRSKVKFRFEAAPPPYKEVLKIKDLDVTVGKGDAQKTLIESVTLDILRDEKVAIIGRNGVGKSTFLKIIQDLLPHTKGKVIWGGNVKYGYFEQEARDLHVNKLVIDELWDRYPSKSEFEIRSCLGSVGLSGENVFKTVDVISGGEKAKLKFSILSLRPSNLLILDEPTNHLDLPSKEVLEDALEAYEGNLIFVSHDRYLLNKVPTKIVELTEGGAVIYEGNYEIYRKTLEDAAKNAPVEPEKPAEDKAENAYYRSKKQRGQEVRRKQAIAKIELKITDLEREIGEMEHEIMKPEIASNFQVMQEKCSLLDTCKEQLNSFLEEWEALMEEYKF